MRTLILGTGALGSLFGARLAAGAGSDVTLAGSWQEAIEAIHRGGVRLAAPAGEWTVPVRAIHRDRLGAESFDLVLVLVKSWQTAGVAAAAASAAGARGRVVTLQNGLGNAETLAAQVSPRRLAVGITTLGASIDAPGNVRWGGDGVTTLAPFAGSTDGRSALLAVRDTLREAGLSCRVVRDGRPLVWQKLAVSCALNPLAALAGVTNGELVRTRQARILVRAVAIEVATIAKAHGVSLDGDPGERAITVARATATNRNSMLQDVDAGRRTEIDALSGAVTAAAEKVGVDAPLNRALAARVTGFERDGFPERRGLECLRELLTRSAA